jgi:ubiquinone/menaquinone biosynthesis C-methylase UbiE
MKKHLVYLATCNLLLFVCLLTLASCQAQKSSKDTGYTFRKATPDGIGKFYMGREISQVMDAAGSDWFDRSSRPREENTQLAIDSIQLPANATIADIGAGTGYYTFKLAPKVPTGKVYAVELQDELIAELNKRKKSLNVNNMEVIKGTVTSPNLPENAIDLAIMVDVYHELEFPVEVLSSIRKSLKKDGRLLLIEYKGEDPAVAIKPLHKTTVAQLKKELAANGFQLSYNGQFMPIQHFLLFKKKD